MSKPCKDCRGRGQWQEQEESNGLVTVSQKVCNTCRNTGKVLDLDDDEDGNYDIGGDSFKDEDDD